MCFVACAWHTCQTCLSELTDALTKIYVETFAKEQLCFYRFYSVCSGCGANLMCSL